MNNENWGKWLNHKSNKDKWIEEKEREEEYHDEDTNPAFIKLRGER